MTGGFGPLASSVPDGSRWKGHTRVLGPSYTHLPTLTIGLLGVGCLVCVAGMLLLGYTRAVAATVTTWGSPANDRLTGFFVATLPLPTLLPFLHAASSLEALAPLVSFLLITALLVRERVLLGGSAKNNPSLLATMRDIWSNARTLPGVIRHIHACALGSPAFRNAGGSSSLLRSATSGCDIAVYRWLWGARLLAGARDASQASPFECLLAFGRTHPSRGHYALQEGAIRSFTTGYRRLLASVSGGWADAASHAYAEDSRGAIRSCFYNCPRLLPALSSSINCWLSRDYGWRAPQTGDRIPGHAKCGAAGAVYYRLRAGRRDALASRTVDGEPLAHVFWMEVWASQCVLRGIRPTAYHAANARAPPRPLRTRLYVALFASWARDVSLGVSRTASFSSPCLPYLASSSISLPYLTSSFNSFLYFSPFASLPPLFLSSFRPSVSLSPLHTYIQPAAFADSGCSLLFIFRPPHRRSPPRPASLPLCALFSAISHSVLHPPSWRATPSPSSVILPSLHPFPDGGVDAWDLNAPADDGGRWAWLGVPDALWVPLPTLWAASHAVFAGCMLGSFFTHSVAGATVLIAFTGFSWGVTQWAPFSLEERTEMLTRRAGAGAGSSISASDGAALGG
ncbi:hypothetical protein C8J57DRAFT_1719951 [Mycena rebaudengoi]|nr:hypothetical protein C8J57DRAFT_1719951 [Mycena rebaudengoi]